MSKFAWVTLTTNDTYSLGALVLAHSLKRVSTTHQLAVLVTPGVSESMRNKLKDVYNIVQEVNVMDSQDSANLALLSRPELGVTFTKLHCWRLVQFEKCVFLDADTLVLQNCDELFEREELSAAPDVSWPDCFNSGVFVYRPSLETFAKIMQFAVQNGSFDGGDQGLLNQYFSDWAHTDIVKHLPFTYNVTAYASYCYLPAFKQFRDKIKILHFAGKLKPWLVTFNSQSRTAFTPSEYQHASDLIQLWWNIFCDNVHPKLNEQMKPISMENIEISTNTSMETENKHNWDIEIDQKVYDPWEDYYQNLDDKDNEQNFTEIEQNTEKFIEQIQEEQIESNTKPDEIEIIVETSSSAMVEPEDTNVEDFPVVEEISVEQVNVPLEAKTISIDSEIIQLPIINDSVSKEITNEDTNSSILPDETKEEAGLAGALSSLRLGEGSTPEQDAYEQLMRRQCWEAGNIDYSGRDSFENIWKRISETLESKPTAAPPTATPTKTTEAKQKSDEKSGSTTN